MSLDPASRTVGLADGRAVTAEAVVIATGSRARRLAGAPAGVHTVRSLDDAAALRADLEPGMAVAVVGAGFIGAEIASTLHGRGHPVTVIEAAPVPLAAPLGLELGAAVAAVHLANGVPVRCGVGVSGFRVPARPARGGRDRVGGDGRVSGVGLVDGTVVPADVVVVGIGADPAVEWLDGSGLDLSAGVVCNAVGATSAPGIWAVGDCSAWYDAHHGRPHRVEHWTDSRDRPAVLARTMLGRTRRNPAGAVLLVRPVRRPDPVRRPPPRRRRGDRRGRQRRGRRPARRLPARGRAGRRARDEPTLAVHALPQGPAVHARPPLVATGDAR